MFCYRRAVKKIIDQGGNVLLNELIGEFPEIICDSTGLAQVTPYQIFLKDVKPAVRCLVSLYSLPAEGVDICNRWPTSKR